MQRTYLELQARVVASPAWRRDGLKDAFLVMCKWAAWCAFEASKLRQECRQMYIDWECDHELNKEFLD